MRFIKQALLPVLMCCAASAGEMGTLEKLIMQVMQYRVCVDVKMSPHARQSAIVLDSGFHSVDCASPSTGFWIPDTGFWTPGTGFWIPGNGFGIPGTGFWIPGNEF